MNEHKIFAGQKVIFGSSKNMTEIEDGTVPFIMTSPPYWNLKDYGNSEEEIGHSSYDEYLDEMNEVWNECYRVASESGVLIINVNSRRHQKRFLPIAFDIVARMKGWRLWDVNLWYIPNALPQPNAYMERLLDNKFEYILVFTKDGRSDYKFTKPRVPQKYISADPRAHKKNPRGRCLGNILRIPAYRPPNVKKMNYHVAAYPEELVAFFLEAYTDLGEKVLDPFLGSGTTLKVARVMGRQGTGYEVNSDFEPLIEARINESWQVPDWRDIDLIHSSSATTGMNGRSRKAHFGKDEVPLGPLDLLMMQEDPG
ncbi:MAG TPA: site-specific DNA-methyltransferase [Sphingobium sp.]|nr:site-specific DNA-methyltransferase [Sphingobium sp.]